MARNEPGPLERDLLALLAQQPTGAYGASLGRDLAAKFNKSVSVGAIYTTLERLERKGFVTSSWGEATPERGGRRKRMYFIQAHGYRALSSAEKSDSSTHFGPSILPQGV